MPTALQASRDFLARNVARVRGGLNEYERRQNSQGPEIAVAPFDAQNVSTPAALIKLGTSIAAARRKKANLEAAQEGIALEKEKTRAEIARLRAAASYDLGQGRQPEAAKPAPVITQGTYKGLTPAEGNIHLREEGLKEARLARENRERLRSLVAPARAELEQIDARAKREADELSLALDPSEGLVNQASSPDPVLQSKALKALGITPEEWSLAAAGKLISPDGNSYLNTRGLLNRVRTKIRAENVAKVRSQVQQRYEPARQRARDVIRQGMPGFDDGLGASPRSDPGEVIDLVIDENGNLVPAPQ